MKTMYRIIKEDGDKKLISGIIYEGYLCQIRKIGIGKGIEKGGIFDGEGDSWTEYKSYRNEYIPVFSLNLIKKYHADMEKAKNIETIDEALADDILKKCLFKLGKNEDGTIIVNYDEEVKQEQQQKKVERDKKNKFLRQHNYCWKKESRYIDSWTAISEGLDDYDGDFKEEWVLRGPDNEVVIDMEDILLKLGYYDKETTKQKLNDKKDIENRKREYQQKMKELNDAKKIVETWFDNHLENSIEIPNSDSVKRDCKGESYHFSGHGHDIYGCGVGYIVDELNKKLWKIKNNGMDGDNWSYNNYETGGAGAIAFLFKWNDEVVNIIKKYCESELYD